MIFGSHFSHAVVKLHHLLVVAVHEVDLEAFHAHLRIVLAHVFHILVDGGVTSPEDNAYVTFLAIIHQLLKVDLRHYLEQVGLFVDCPALVQDDVFDAVF